MNSEPPFIGSRLRISKTNVQRNKPVVNNGNTKITILEYFTPYPIISTKQKLLESRLSKSSVLRILWKHKFALNTSFRIQHLKTH